MTAETLSSLNIKRGAIKRKLTLAQNALPDLSCLMEIQERLTKLRPIYDEFFEIQMQIEDIEISLNQTSTADQGTTFDKDYHSVLSKLRTLEAQHKPQSQQTTISNPISNSNEVNQKSVPVKLPELTLPSFDGSYSDWTSFYDTFSALVDQNTQLSEIHKFHYLKSCLKGNAIKTIESLKVTAENYYIAWSLLQNRYSNQRLIVQEHIFGILNHNNLNKPSYQELRKLLDTVSSHLEALNVHDITPQMFRDVTLVAIISEKLDFVSKREWQSKLTTNLPPTWDQLKEFLEKRCETLETLHLMSNKSVSHDNNSKKVNPKVVANVSTNKGKKSNSDNNKILTCPCCSQNHNLFHCAQFINLTVKDRINLVHSKHLCNNCFRDNHVASTCKSEYRCKICKESHNTLLHETLSQRNNNQQPPTVLKINSHQVYFSNVILPTAQVQVYDHWGKKHVFRALLDSGSQLNFVSERVAKLLKLKLQPVVLSVAGINQSLTNASNVTDIKIQSNYEDYNSNLSCVVIPQISEFLPCNSFSTANLKFPQHIQLADPTFHVKGAIDLLIGAQVFFQLLKPNRESLAQNFLLQETKLGWVVVNSCYNNGQDIAIRNLCHFVQPALEQMVNKFWELDSFKNETIINQDEALCEKIFADHHKRSKTGKYVVPLPFKQEKRNLGTSRAGAIKRFKSLECKFRRDKGFKTVYAKVIEDYFRQGHAEQVPANELDNPCYYLPHHGVTKEESTTTQLRVVFDASAKTSNQKSLNDLLLIGPKIQSDLYSILLRFREHVAFTADIISRGCTPKQLIDNKLWLNGPTFLWQNETDHSDNIKNIINPSETEERSRIVCTKAVINDESSELLLKYSSFKKLINIIALCFRFYNKIKGEKITEPLSVKEIRFSHNVIVKLVQQEAFPDEYNCLVKNKPLPKSSPLIKLNPFLDADSIIRVGGRLVNANIFYNKKFPIVIPKRHHITNLIVEREHLRQLHAGPQATLAAIRESYWLLGGRNTIRRILHNCVLCRRASPITYEEIMGNLPDARVNLIRPFRDCGVDYAGPISIREGKGRGKRSIKAYVCLFICLATKAIHLELVTDCTSSSFIGAFKRFMSRRGKPSRMYSDNATTFKGSDRELRFIHQEVTKSELFKNFISNCAENNVEWHFIPPRSPHVGGIWEAGIKSMKFHFKRIIGQSLFTYEEMYTCLTLIEACLNSRPITSLSSNPDDLSPLTPGHFLIGTALTAPAEPVVTEINIHRLDQWQKIQQVRQHFWKRWSREYIVELQQRSKWATSTRPAAVGDIVIVHEDNIPPLCWSLGRIEAVQPGRDGKVRTVSVRTKSGVVKRSVHKLSPLPV
jgi:hypothetical protein